jgi:hypothetical protein
MSADLAADPPMPDIGVKWCAKVRPTAGAGRRAGGGANEPFRGIPARQPRYHHQRLPP